MIKDYKDVRGKWLEKEKEFKVLDHKHAKMLTKLDQWDLTEMINLHGKFKALYPQDIVSRDVFIENYLTMTEEEKIKFKETFK